MFKTKNIIDAIIIALIIFSLQDYIIFNSVSYEGPKQFIFYLLKGLLAIIYFLFVTIIIDSEYKYTIENSKKNGYMLAFSYSSLAFVFSMSSLIFNNKAVDFDILAGAYALISGNAVFILYLKLKELESIEAYIESSKPESGD